MRKEHEPSTMEEPPTEFVMWWSPDGTDQESGADVGGHPDARRIWARKDPGRWTRRTYGTTARIAWNAQMYRSEYLRWIEAGRPEREEFISLAASTERQKQFWHDLKPVISKIGKPMPEPQLADSDAKEFQPF